MALSKYDLKFYLTSVEPVVEQTIYSQSIGGYCAFVPTNLAESLVYPETTLNSSIGFYDSVSGVSNISIVPNGGFVGLDNQISFVTTSGSNVNFLQSQNGIAETHLSGDVVRILSGNSLLNNNFNDSFKQYRCIAVRNNNQTEIANNVQVFIKQQSLNLGSTIRIAVEVPQNDFVFGTASATATSKRQLVDSTLAGVFADNHFATAVLRFTSGNNINQSRIITSSDNTTGIVIVDSDFPFISQAGDKYAIDPGPAQRIGTGIATPNFGTATVSSLSLAPQSNPINFNVNGSRDHGEQFMPNDIFYIWVERTLDKDASSYEDNSAVISISFTSSFVPTEAVVTFACSGFNAVRNDFTTSHFVGTITTNNLNDTAEDYTAVINWSDGSPPQPGIISYQSPGLFTVHAVHGFTQFLAYTYTITYTRQGSAPYTTYSCSVSVS